MPWGWLCDLLLPSGRAPTGCGHLACAGRGTRDPTWPKGADKIKGRLGYKGNTRRRPNTIKA